MNVGGVIKKARLAKGLTQEELGLMIGVQKSAIAKYESGRVVNLKKSVIHKLAEALEIRPSALIGGEREVSDKAGEISDKKKALIERILEMSETDLDKFDQILRIVENTK